MPRRTVTNVEQLRALLAKSSLKKNTEYLLGLIRPAIDIVKSPAKPTLGGSRFGGSPDLPAGTMWPQHEMGSYSFLAQLNFAEVPPVGGLLPTSGLLSLFVGVDSEDGEFFWQTPGYVKAMFIAEGTPLVTLPSPKNVSLGKATAVEFHETIDLPFDGEQAEAWPITDYDEQEKYSALRDKLHVSEHYLLGYPSHCSLGYDPTPSPQWTSLLTLDSDERLKWHWHDSDKLMVFIERSRLKQKDFSVLASDAG